MKGRLEGFDGLIPQNGQQCRQKRAITDEPFGAKERAARRPREATVKLFVSEEAAFWPSVYFDSFDSGLAAP